MATRSISSAPAFDPDSPAVRAAERLILEEDHLSFTAHFFREREGQPFIIGPHHEVMGDALNRVLRGESTRLLINVPPGFTKTEEAVISFVAHGLALEPRARFIHATYAEKLALENSSKVRETIMLEGYQRHWPLRLKDDTNAKGLWRTEQGGGMMAAPAGGTITGFRAGQMFPGFSGALIIDDPLKPDDARSPEVRGHINARYMNTFRSRLAHEGVPIIVIMQRLDVEDMSGHLLTGGGGEVFDHLWLPAEIRPRTYPVEWTHGIAIDHGLPEGPLWADKLNEDQLRVLKVNPEVYAAQYDQDPQIGGSDYFKVEWFKAVDPPPRAEMRVYGASDYAVTADGGDYTVHIVVGLDADGRLHMLDLWRKQAASDEWVEAFCDLVRKWKPIGWAEEQGQIKAGVGPFLTKRMREREAFVHREMFPTRGDKSVRAQSIRGRVAMDGLRIGASNAWRADFVSECLRFPAGVHDDQVDALGLVGQLLDKMVKGTKPLDQTAKPDTGYRAFGAKGRPSWR